MTPDSDTSGTHSDGPARRHGVHLGTWAPGHLGTWAPGHLGTWAPGHLGTWAPGTFGPALVRCEFFLRDLHHNMVTLVTILIAVSDIRCLSTSVAAVARLHVTRHVALRHRRRQAARHVRPPVIGIGVPDYPNVDIQASSTTRPQSARLRQTALRPQNGPRSPIAPATRKDLGKIYLAGRFTPLLWGKSTATGKLSAKYGSQYRQADRTGQELAHDTRRNTGRPTGQGRSSLTTRARGEGLHLRVPVNRHHPVGGDGEYRVHAVREPSP